MMALLGVDVSEYQGVMDWDKCQAAGARFAFVRVGCGPEDIDKQFERNRAEAPARLPTGGYWALHPDYPAMEQADLFCDHLARMPWLMAPWVDMELLGTCGLLKRSEQLEVFLLRCYMRLGLLPAIYTRALWFNVNICPNLLWCCTDLAVARYSDDLAGPWSDGECIPRDWEEWEYWQWSADGNLRGPEFGAQSDSIDLDYFNGVLPDFQGRVTVKGPAWLRSSPSGAICGSTWGGRVLTSIGEARTSSHGDWFQVASWIHKGNVK